MRQSMPSNNSLAAGVGDRLYEEKRHINTERKHKPIGQYLLFAWILFLYVFACYYALDNKNQLPSAKVDMTIPQDFRSRLKKHGLDKQFSIIEISKGTLYFYRGEKRCKF
jgi:hypothetical protein